MNESLISPNAMSHGSFDRLVKDINGKLTVCCCCLVPMHILSQTGFWLQWPGRNTISRTHSAISTAAQDLLKVVLNETDAVALCVDIWSSKRQHGYLGVTAHCLDAKGLIKNLVLGCPRFSGSHTADDIFGLVVELIEKYGIREKIRYIGTDNAANMLKAFRDWMPGFLEKPEYRESSNSKTMFAAHAIEAFGNLVCTCCRKQRHGPYGLR